MANTINTFPFHKLPLKLRQQISDYVYEDHPHTRNIKVSFHQALDPKCVQIYANPVWPALMSVSFDARAHLKKRFVKPFSSSLIAPDNQSLLSGQLNPELSPGSFAGVPIGLAKDKLSFISNSDHWLFNYDGEPGEYLHLFRLLFEENYDMVVNNLTKLQVQCNIGPVFIQEFSALKTNLPNLKEFTLICDCHVVGDERWAMFASEFTDAQLKSTQNGVAVTFQLCGVAIAIQSKETP